MVFTQCICYSIGIAEACPKSRGSTKKSSVENGTITMHPSMCNVGNFVLLIYIGELLLHDGAVMR
jgi:hypothetical protein